MELTPEEIGQRIKKKYSQYTKIADDVLGNVYIKKFGPVTDPSKKGDIISPLPSSTQTPSSATPTVPSGNSNVNLAMKLIQQNFPQDQWQNALAVARGESGFNPAAVGDQYPIGGVLAPSYGLFQIRGLPGRPAKEQLLDPEFNVKYAADLYKQQGWRPWTAARKLGLVR